MLSFTLKDRVIDVLEKTRSGEVEYRLRSLSSVTLATNLETAIHALSIKTCSIP